MKSLAKLLSTFVNLANISINLRKAYSESGKTSKMEHFTKIVNGF